MFTPQNEEITMRCCCPRTLNLNKRNSLNAVFGEHNERNDFADSRSCPLRRSY